MAPKLIELAAVIKMANERKVTAAAIVEAREGWYARVTLGSDESILAAPEGVEHGVGRRELLAQPSWQKKPVFSISTL